MSLPKNNWSNCSVGDSSLYFIKLEGYIAASDLYFAGIKKGEEKITEAAIDITETIMKTLILFTKKEYRLAYENSLSIYLKLTDFILSMNKIKTRVNKKEASVDTTTINHLIG